MNADKIFRAHGRFGLRLIAACGLQQNAPLGCAIGIEHVDLHQEAIELRFGQRIGAFLLQRVLRRQHMERARQIVALASHRHVIFLHGLQQRRLRARAGAVDLVRHQQLREDRPAHKAERAAPVGGLLHDFRAQNVGGHQIGRELHAPRIEPQHRPQRLDELGFGQTRHADQQAMAARQQRDERLLHHLLLAEDDLAHGGARGGDLLQRALSLLCGVFRKLRIGETLDRAHSASFSAPFPFGRAPATFICDSLEVAARLSMDVGALMCGL